MKAVVRQRRRIKENSMEKRRGQQELVAGGE
jgi:hypothetical protein